MVQNLCDLHSHTDCSFDGTRPMREMCARAQALGLKYYALTDHCECDQYDGAPAFGGRKYYDVVRRAWREMEQIGEEFPGLTILRGIELGQPLQNLPAALDALEGRDYDLVIGSLHGIAGQPDFYHLGQTLRGAEKEAALARYFEELLEMVRWGNFDTLAHITYPLRYLSRPGERASFAGHEKALDSVLKALIEGGKALEFNTSRFPAKEGEPILPDREVFARYKELGGTKVTLGADAHTAENVAKGVAEAMEVLKELGYKSYTVFIGREAKSVPMV